MLVFMLMHAVPGGPFDELKSPLPVAAKANILHKYGLDKPVWTQYSLYIWHALHGDFGIPYESPTETVLGLIARVWPVTLLLGAIVIAMSFTFGSGMGILAALRRDTWLDNLLTFLSTLGYTVPNFIVAIWFIVIFSVRLHWLPTGGWGESRLLIMPALAYALQPMAIVARYTRVAVIEALVGDYVRTAKAKGLSPGRVVLRHVLRNALIPIVTLLGPWVPELFTGSIFIEVTFRIPGLGRFFATSVFQRDYPMIMATMLLVALLWSIAYLLSDLLYFIIDPRMRVG
jgi:ABC-type dipeptide/oligopeptide/nickel transport system permease component